MINDVFLSEFLLVIFFSLNNRYATDRHGFQFGGKPDIQIACSEELYEQVHIL